MCLTLIISVCVSVFISLPVCPGNKVMGCVSLYVCVRVCVRVSVVVWMMTR